MEFDEVDGRIGLVNDSEIEVFLTFDAWSVLSLWELDFMVCPVGCSGSGLEIGAVLRLDDNPNVVMSFGLFVGAGGLLGLPNTTNGGGCFAEVDEPCLDSCVGFAAWKGFVLVKESGVVLLVVGEGEVSEMGVVIGEGAGVEVGIGRVMEADVTLAGCIVLGLGSGLYLGDRAGSAG